MPAPCSCNWNWFWALLLPLPLPPPLPPPPLGRRCSPLGAPSAAVWPLLAELVSAASCWTAWRSVSELASPKMESKMEPGWRAERRCLAPPTSCGGSRGLPVGAGCVARGPAPARAEGPAADCGPTLDSACSGAARGQQSSSQTASRHRLACEMAWRPFLSPGGRPASGLSTSGSQLSQRLLVRRGAQSAEVPPSGPKGGRSMCAGRLSCWLEARPGLSAGLAAPAAVLPVCLLSVCLSIYLFICGVSGPGLMERLDQLERQQLRRRKASAQQHPTATHRGWLPPTSGPNHNLEQLAARQRAVPRGGRPLAQAAQSHQAGPMRTCRWALLVCRRTLPAANTHTNSPRRRLSLVLAAHSLPLAHTVSLSLCGTLKRLNVSTDESDSPEQSRAPRARQIRPNGALQTWPFSHRQARPLSSSRSRSLASANSIRTPPIGPPPRTNKWAPLEAR